MAYMVLSREMFEDPFGFELGYDEDFGHGFGFDYHPYGYGRFGYRAPYRRSLVNPNPFYGVVRSAPHGYRRFTPYGFYEFPRSSLFLIHRKGEDEEESPSKESKEKKLELEKTEQTEQTQKTEQTEKTEGEDTKKQVGRLGQFGFDLGLPIVSRNDEGDHYLYDVSIPSNVQKEDLDLSFRGSYMILKGTKKVEKKEETEGGIQFQTSSYSSWSRVLTVPQDVNRDAVEAHFEDGHLKIYLGKHVSEDGMSKDKENEEKKEEVIEEKKEEVIEEKKEEVIEEKKEVMGEEEEKMEEEETADDGAGIGDEGGMESDEEGSVVSVVEVDEE
eukprot:TRINITY_DN123_c0_g1_i5.p1 TRINITY_DN123_c0_g1~~TRINITY_DN123_c0_g1_i5.p1  ORF type:complete len:329 (+),score=147.78 TRINITY_DN123_c0_g1_i5:91-1077(+)